MLYFGHLQDLQNPWQNSKLLSKLLVQLYFAYHNLIAVGYPANEAASYDQLVYRQREAPQLFLGYLEGSKLIGVSFH